MKNRFLEAGRIVNTHGIQGEVKILPWCDSAEFLMSFDTFYLDEKPVKVLTARIHKGNLLVTFDGVDTINGAMRLKGKVVLIDRNDVSLPAGRYFLADLIGLEVLDAADGRVLGTLVEVLTPSVQHVYVVKGEKEYLIPAVDEFIVETNVDSGYIKVKLIEGMGE